MWWQASLYWCSVIGILLTGVFVAFRQQKLYNVAYGVFSVSLAVWLVCQYFIDRHLSGSWLGLGFIALDVIAPSFLIFIYALSKGRITWVLWVLGLVPLLLLGPFSFSDLLINIQVVQGSAQLIFGPLYAVHSYVVLTYLVIALIVLTHSYVIQRNPQRRRQYALFFVAFIPFLLAGLISGLLLPNEESVQFLRPLGALLMVGIITYAIVFHKLFDIRLIVARAVVYAFSLFLISTINGLVVLVIAKRIFDISMTLTAEISLALLMGVLALSFSHFSRQFATSTKRLFFQDTYDSQELFNDLNKLLVSSLDIKYLMQRSTAIISSYLKPEMCLVALWGDEDERSLRVYGAQRPGFSVDDMQKLRQYAAQSREDVIVGDELDDDRDEVLKDIMQKNKIALLVCLRQDARKADYGMGYVALGGKKSGGPYGMQDIRTLEAVANELVLAIQNALHFEEIQKFNEVLQARVDEATRKLRRTNEKLRALDETKDDFISMASHQLRTPLTSVKGYLSMVLEGDAGEINDTQRKMLGQAFTSSQRMVYLIADLLNVSRLKTGKFVIEAAPLSLAHLVSEEIDQLVETAAAREITLTYDKPKNFPELMLDETKTRQVIMNFVDNAIYYTPAGGSIHVELEETPTSVELRVVDNGMGVPKAEQHHLFTKFYRAGNARKARPDGTGLGLFMAKKVILAQGGSILFNSVEGKGSTFGFLFPKTLLPKATKLPVTEVERAK
jgi:signal transduction histidine kinase